MDYNYYCAVYGIHKPQKGDRFFTYTGEVFYLDSPSIMELYQKYLDLKMRDGTIKCSAQVYQCCMKVAQFTMKEIVPFRGTPEDPQYNFRELQKIAYRNAELLGCNNDILESIERGNAHEIIFFSDDRVFTWLEVKRYQEQCSLFDKEE